MNTSLNWLRWRLTFWYVTIFTVIMALFGLAIYRVVTHEVEKGLDRSLARTVDIRTRWVLERTRPPSVRFSENDSIPLERQVVVFSAKRRKVCEACPRFWELEPISQPQTQSYIWKFALNVLNDSVPKQRVTTPDGRNLLLYGKKVTARSGRVYATVAVADAVELENQYPTTFTGLIAAALTAILLVGLGGAILGYKSTQPIEHAFDQMRRFMGDAAHELKTPIAVLRARTDVALQKKRTPAEYQQTLTGVSTEAERLGSLVDNMLVLARIDAGQWPVHRGIVLLDDVVMDAANSARALVDGKALEVDVQTAANTSVNGDPTLLRQLFMILLENAIKFTPDGGKISVKVERQRSRSHVIISDTGVGIPAAALPHIFERFFRADPARARGGAGLGLSIARWIVDVHKGRIEVMSTEGRGTTVRVTLPT